MSEPRRIADRREETERVRAYRHVEPVCLLILASIALGFALYFLKPVLIPFLLALFFILCLSSMIRLQVKYLRLPYRLAIALTGLTGVVILAGMGLLIADVASRISAESGDYQQRLSQLGERIAQVAPLASLGIKPDPESGRFFEISEEHIRQLILAGVTALRSVISSGLMVFVFMIFLLAGHAKAQIPQGSVLREIEREVTRYINVTVYLSAATAALIAITFALLGVRFALVFGLLIFFLNFIPQVGAVAANLVPVPVILLSSELSTTAKVLALVIPVVIEFVMGNLVQARLQGSSLKLHPVTVLMSLIFFSMIWGIPGAFLATPIAAVIRIILDRIPDTRPLARLLAGDLSMSSPVVEPWRGASTLP